MIIDFLHAMKGESSELSSQYSSHDRTWDKVSRKEVVNMTDIRSSTIKSPIKSWSQARLMVSR